MELSREDIDSIVHSLRSIAANIEWISNCVGEDDDGGHFVRTD
jgi:hypothetical protein